MSPDAFDALLRQVTSDWFRAQLIVGDLCKVASLIGSMHWTLCARSPQTPQGCSSEFPRRFERSAALGGAELSP